MFSSKKEREVYERMKQFGFIDGDNRGNTINDLADVVISLVESTVSFLYLSTGDPKVKFTKKQLFNHWEGIIGVATNQAVVNIVKLVQDPKFAFLCKMKASIKIEKPIPKGDQ